GRPCQAPAHCRTQRQSGCPAGAPNRQARSVGLAILPASGLELELGLGVACHDSAGHSRPATAGLRRKGATRSDVRPRKTSTPAGSGGLPRLALALAQGGAGCWTQQAAAGGLAPPHPGAGGGSLFDVPVGDLEALECEVWLDVVHGTTVGADEGREAPCGDDEGVRPLPLLADPPDDAVDGFDGGVEDAASQAGFGAFAYYVRGRAQLDAGQLGGS